MKNKNILNKSVLVGILALTSLSSCTDDFTEINTNPNGPVIVPSDLALGSIQEATADRLYDTFVGGDMGACWIQHYGKVQYNSEARYEPRVTTLNNTWNGFYSEGLQDAKRMYELAEEEGNMANMGVAKVMQTYIFSIMTELYGDIPFSESLFGAEGFTPAYDKQSSVYTGMIAMLDDATSMLAGEGVVSSTQDLMYGGDVSKWSKFANSLKFRLLMRMSNKENVGTALQALVNAGGMFTSNADNAQLVYLETNPNANPVWNTVIFSTRSEWKINETVVTILNSLGDPRVNVYGQLNDGGIIRGVAPGVQDPTLKGFGYANTSALGEYFLQPSTPAVFMSYSELNFLIAEAAKRGLISGGDAAAQAAYEAGIMASFATYNSFEGINIDAATYLTNPDVAYDANTALTQIGTQNYLALFGQGVEAYTEWRRTKIPTLSAAIDPLGGLTEIPSRWVYPSDEKSLNSTNYNAAASSIGGDKLTTKLWFMN